MILVVTPALGWSWPALVPIVGLVAAVRGYKFLTDDAHFKSRLTRKMEKMRRESVAIDEVLTEVIADEIGNEERLNFERDDLILVFRKDARGKFFVEVAGPKKKTKLDLRIRAEEFAYEIIRKFAYHKLAEQLTHAGATIVEKKIEDNRITLIARK